MDCWYQKKFNELFKNIDCCYKCDKEDVPCENVLDWAECKCCLEWKGYCKDCFFEYLFYEYKNTDEASRFWRQKTKDVEEEIRKLKGEK